MNSTAQNSYRPLVTALYGGALALSAVAAGRGVELTGAVKAAAPWLRCPLHTLTGMRCPTCGLGRSLIRTWTWDWGAAWTMHPAGPVLFVLATVWLLLWWVRPEAAAAAPAWLGRGLRAWPAAGPLLVGLYLFWGLALRAPPPA